MRRLKIICWIVFLGGITGLIWSIKLHSGYMGFIFGIEMFVAASFLHAIHVDEKAHPE